MKLMLLSCLSLLLVFITPIVFLFVYTRRKMGKGVLISYYNKSWTNGVKVRKILMYLVLVLFTPISLLWQNIINFPQLLVINCAFAFTLTNHVLTDFNGPKHYF